MQNKFIMPGQDIAIVTGAEYVAKDLGMKVATTGVEALGTARKARSHSLLIDDQHIVQGFYWAVPVGK